MRSTPGRGTQTRSTPGRNVLTRNTLTHRPGGLPAGITEGEAVHFEFRVEAGDFANAGRVSSEIKKILKELNIDGTTVRRTVVALFESEVNVVGHSYGGTISVDITSREIRILVTDTGPGIENIELAMSEGYSTADEEILEMGFGAGMGLPNIKKNTDSFDLRSEVGKYTELEMTISLDGGGE